MLRSAFTVWHKAVPPAGRNTYHDGCSLHVLFDCPMNADGQSLRALHSSRWQALTLTSICAGSEIYYVISGTVEAGIQEEASTGRFISVNVTAGQNVVAPQGLMHYIQNNECTGVSLLQIWNNADPGTVVLYANMVNNFPDRALAAFTGLDAVSSCLLPRCFLCTRGRDAEQDIGKRRPPSDQVNEPQWLHPVSPVISFAKKTLEVFCHIWIDS